MNLCINCLTSKQMTKQSVLAKQCPVCGFRPVEQIRGPKEVGSPTHRCPSCSTLLKPAFTVRILLAIPIGAFSLGMAYLGINWLNHVPALSGAVRAAVLGGLGAFCTAITLNAAVRGIVFRPIQTKP